MGSGAGRKTSGSSSGPNGAAQQQSNLLNFGFSKASKDRSPLKEKTRAQQGREEEKTPPQQQQLLGKGAPSGMGTGRRDSNAEGGSTPASRKRASDATPSGSARKVVKSSRKDQAPTPPVRSTPRRDRKPPAKATLEAKLLEAAEAARVKRDAKRKKDKESKAAEKEKKRLAEKANKEAEAEKAKKKKAEEREQQKAERERIKAEQKKKAEAEREAKKKAEAEERERKKAEALEAKRYPIDDLLLQKEELKKGKPLKEIVLPELTGKEEGAELGRLLYVSDVTQRFSKELGIKPVSLNALQDALEGKEIAAAAGGAPKYTAAFEIIARLYEGLLATNLEDEVQSGVGGRTERRWVSLLGPGTWPEVLRRYILTLHKFAQEEEDVVQHVDEEAAEAAAMLGRLLPEDLTPSQHLLLLEALCNEALATAELRDCLALRLEEADGVLKKLRIQRQEDRSKIREVEAELKEERRQRKIKEQAEAEQQQQTEGAAEGEAVPPPPKDPLEEEEPSWELPPELKEFTGASDDRKGLLEWRQRAAAERQRLEKEKLRWHAEKRRLIKEREKAMRAEHEQRRAKERELERLQDELADKEEAYEQKLDKYIIRQVPLGLDRYYRRYWWGLGGVRGVVYVEAEDGCWARLSSLEELGGLVKSLDQRGVREAELLDNIDKQHGIIAKAMKRVAAEADKMKKAEEREILRERVLPKRGAAKKVSLADLDEAPRAKSVEEEALWVAVDKTDEVAAMAQSRGCAPLAAGGYRKVREELQILRVNGLRGRTSEEVLEQLQELLVQLEMRLFVLSGQPEVDPDDESEDEDDEDEDEERGNRRRSQRMSRIMSSSSVTSNADNSGRAVKPSGKDLEVHEYIHESADEDDGVDRNGRERWRRGAKTTWMYRNIKERRSWRAALDAGTCMPAVAYSAATLSIIGADMLEELADAAE